MQISLVKTLVLNQDEISGFISFPAICILLQKYLIQVLPRSHLDYYLLCSDGLQNRELHLARGLQSWIMDHRGRSCVKSAGHWRSTAWPHGLSSFPLRLFILQGSIFPVSPEMLAHLSLANRCEQKRWAPSGQNQLTCSSLLLFSLPGSAPFQKEAGALPPGSSTGPTRNCVDLHRM